MTIARPQAAEINAGGLGLLGSGFESMLALAGSSIASVPSPRCRDVLRRRRRRFHGVNKP